MSFVISEGELSAVAGITSPASPIPSIAIPRGITGYRGLFGSYEAIYATQPNVRTVVDFLARNVGQLTARLIEQTAPDVRSHKRDHPLDRLLRRPHPRWSRHRFTRALVSDICVFDNWIAGKVRVNGTGPAVALSRIPPQFVEPVGGDWIAPEGFRIMGGPRVWPVENFVHIPGYNPSDARWGVSAIATLKRILDEDLSAGEAREQFWQRAARFGNGWIERPVEAPSWTDPARERWRSEWSDLYTGDGPEAGGTPLLEEGMKFHAETFDAAAAQYLEARKLTKIECASAFHVNPGLVGFIERADIAQDSSRKSLYADTFAPLCDNIAGEFVNQLLADFEPGADAFDRFDINFDLDEKLTGDFSTEAEATSRAVGAPWLLRNEARARRGLAPVDGGDQLITPLNVTTGGRASPADTAPGTPGAGQAARNSARKRRPVLTKALEDFGAVDRAWAEQHAAIVATNADRQRARVLSRTAAGQDLGPAFDLARANTELETDLQGLALDYNAVAAAPVAEHFGVEYDAAVAENWLLNNASIAAQNYNAGTLAALEAVHTNMDLNNADGLTQVFDEAAGSRADGFGIDRVGTVGNFSRHDAAKQGGATEKTWRTNSRNPRPSHVMLSGTTVGIHDTFDVGGTEAAYPGDPNLSADENAGCSCTVDFT